MNIFKVYCQSLLPRCALYCSLPVHALLINSSRKRVLVIYASTPCSCTKLTYLALRVLRVLLLSRCKLVQPPALLLPDLAAAAATTAPQGSSPPAYTT